MSAPAFADPVFQSQATFRAVLAAMSRPGTIQRCGGDLAPPAPLAAAAGAALLTLIDFETPVWLSPAFVASEVGQWLRFHIDAPIVDAPDRAAFALIDLERDALELASCAQGTSEYPDRSTTIVAQAASLADDGPLRLAGPGIRGDARLGFAPSPTDFLAQWRNNGQKFPLGVDLILASGDRLVGLPRTTRILGAA
jgi:alpha-D-ribose 1-methylphosphonate 5-triphosphate synthase subunit PhnH